MEYFTHFNHYGPYNVFINPIYQNSVFSDEFVPSISGVRKIHKSAGSGLFFATGAHDMYAASHHDIHLSRIGLDISSSV